MEDKNHDTDYYFNPRPRKEGDLLPLKPQKRNRNFNPRPRKEGDADELENLKGRGDFNPRPRKEGDRVTG